MTVAVGVNSDGRREVLGMDSGPSGGPKTFWTGFLAQAHAGAACVGVKLVVSDAHEGIKGPPVSKVADGPPGKRCRVHIHA